MQILTLIFGLFPIAYAASGGAGYAVDFPDTRDAYLYLPLDTTTSLSWPMSEPMTVSFFWKTTSRQQSIHVPFSIANSRNDQDLTLYCDSDFSKILTWYFRGVKLSYDVENETAWRNKLYDTGFTFFASTTGNVSNTSFTYFMIDGVVVDNTTAVMPPPIANATLMLGQEMDKWTPNYGLDKAQAGVGVIDEVRVWTKHFAVDDYLDGLAPMTTVQAKSKADLWAYWDFDVSSNYLEDIANGRTLIKFGDASLTPSPLLGMGRDLIGIIGISSFTIADAAEGDITISSLSAGLTCTHDGSALFAGATLGTELGIRQVSCTGDTSSFLPMASGDASNVLGYSSGGVAMKIVFYRGAKPGPRDPIVLIEESALSGIPVVVESTTSATSATTITTTIPTKQEWTVQEDSVYGTRLGASHADRQTMQAKITVVPEKGILMQFDSDTLINTSNPIVTYGRSLRYKPLTDGVGPAYAFFTYILLDNTGAESDPINVTIDVTAVNDAPDTTHNSDYTLDEEDTKVVTLVGTDADGTPTSDLTFTINQLPSHGKLYQIKADGTRGEQIIAAFKAWDFGQPKEQWAQNASAETWYAETGPWSIAMVEGPIDARTGCHSGTYTPSTITGSDALEHLQFDVAEAVWPTSVQVHWPSGGWTSSFKALDEATGIYVPLWTAPSPGYVGPGPVDFTPPLCAPNFKSKTFRVGFVLDEFMTSWSCLDGVRLTGEERFPNGVVTNSAKKVMYVPDKDYDGPDGFKYQVNDCLERTFAKIDNSDPSVETSVTFTIRNVNDVPIVEPPTVIVLRTAPYIMDLATRIIDPDDSSHEIEIVSISNPGISVYSAPVNSIITDGNSSVAIGDDWTVLVAGSSVSSSNISLAFQSSCLAPFAATITLKVTDATGASTIAEFAFDNTCIVNRIITIKSLENGAALGVSVVAGLGLVLVLAGLGITVAFRKTPVIRLAQPCYLTTMLLGCALLYSGIIAWGTGSGPSRCYVPLVLYSCGFTFVFMSFYVKTYRIDQIFNGRSTSAVTAASVAKRFVAGISIELIFIILWVMLGPIMPDVTWSSETLGYDVCAPVDQTGLIMVIVCLGFKAIHLGVNVNLALKVRKVNSAFNESKLIAFCVYNFAFFVCVLFPLGLSMADPTTGFIIMSLAIWMPTTATVGTMFGSKAVIALFNPEENTTAAMSGGEFGVKVQTTFKSQSSSQLRRGRSKVQPVPQSVPDQIADLVKSTGKDELLKLVQAAADPKSERASERASKRASERASERSIEPASERSLVSARSLASERASGASENYSPKPLHVIKLTTAAQGGS